MKRADAIAGRLKKDGNSRADLFGFLLSWLCEPDTRKASYPEHGCREALMRRSAIWKMRFCVSHSVMAHDYYLIGRTLIRNGEAVRHAQ
jgi:hypothetical protein